MTEVEVGQTWKCPALGVEYEVLWVGEVHVVIKRTNGDEIMFSIAHVLRNWTLINPLPLPEGWEKTKVGHYQYTSKHYGDSIRLDYSGVTVRVGGKYHAVVFPVKDLPEIVARLLRDTEQDG